jgi:hypothetical protein
MSRSAAAVMKRSPASPTAMLLLLALGQMSACTDEPVAPPPAECATPDQVKQFIHKNGYANVTQIRHGEKGWEAVATLGGAPVRLTVDNQCYRVRLKE